ncbi:MAG: DUF1289 domain-containing protein [Sphingopyxis sp.]|jgi:predicted Fe-S protein YdhL (DUF1289 family)|uniref:DUF1289 domain-containing protein n=1 Tax=Sphingopyxis TaxID=165697 RepID=UPI0007883E00|nr:MULTISPECIES: DUF1289 domain-containing protein [Sphingopyxis]KAB2855155.1 MAG: DUF1289 domain-containing protein [Sphingopyxis terrae]MBL9064797.1 DUF1289 domain-containing protein [Sphingopyxis sp.]MBN8845170.1 DUF1289 domain-containing protein [Sphingomonadales bacterium]
MRSPCIELCAFDGRTGWCRGCGRTQPECRSWKKASPFQQRKLASELPRRLAKLTQEK